jgi:hypothetical protein
MQKNRPTDTIANRHDGLRASSAPGPASRQRGCALPKELLEEPALDSLCSLPRRLPRSSAPRPLS